MIIVFQFIFSLFVLFAIFGVVQKKKNGLLSLRAAVFWILFWLVAAVMVVWPETSSMLAERLGIGRGTDLIVYSAIAVLFFIIFRLQIKLEQMNRHITRVVREKALEQGSNKSINQ